MKKIIIICISVVLTATLILSLRTYKIDLKSHNNTDQNEITDLDSSVKELVLFDKSTEKIYASYDVCEGDQFTVTFIHSVNKSPVTDVYEIRDDGIWLIENVYYGFGAGVPAELKNDEYLETGPDNSMIIKNMDTKMDSLIYVVGTVSDHTLEIGGEEISLRDTCGQNSHVVFELK